MQINSEILNKLKTIKTELKNDGVNIIGVFGSYARGDFTENSDVDILYELDNPSEFAEKYNGFGAFTRLIEIKENIANQLGKSIDFVPKNSLSLTGEKFILKDLLNV